MKPKHNILIWFEKILARYAHLESKLASKHLVYKILIFTKSKYKSIDKKDYLSNSKELFEQYEIELNNLKIVIDQSFLKKI